MRYSIQFVRCFENEFEIVLRPQWTSSVEDAPLSVPQPSRTTYRSGMLLGRYDPSPVP